tara:strand:+ start:168 stop:1004 length:837 start_codon:yes stop_codon:yes gene_type:complete
MKKIFFIFVCLFVCNAQAGLIGLASGSPGKLFSIDETTGAATVIVSVDAICVGYAGATFLNGSLYGSGICDLNTYTTSAIGTIDISTGDYSFVNDMDGSSGWHGLATDENAGLIYAIDIFDGNTLKSMTSTGLVTSIGSGAGIDGRGMAYDDFNDILYAADLGGGLYTVDTLLGTSTFIGNMGISTTTIGLAFDETTGVLYANEGANLYSVDTVSGLATLIGRNDFSDTDISGIDGLAWLDTTPSEMDSVPAPASSALLGLGLVAIGFFRKKKLNSSN